MFSERSYIRLQAFGNDSSTCDSVIVTCAKMDAAEVKPIFRNISKNKQKTNKKKKTGMLP